MMWRQEFRIAADTRNRKEKFESLNAFVRSRNAWLISSSSNVMLLALAIIGLAIFISWWMK